MIGAGGRELLGPVVNPDVTASYGLFIPVPEACEITRLFVTVTSTMTGILTTTLEIDGTLVTGSTNAMGTSAAAGTTVITKCTAANKVAAGGAIEVIFDITPSGGTFAVAMIEIVKGPLGPLTA